MLVVDSDEHTRRLVVRCLQEDGIAVRVAATGVEALRSARLESPDLIILEVALPDLNSIAVAHQLRAICGPDLPILAVTEDEEIAGRAFQMGAYSLLEKPYEPEHLVVAVRRGLLERSNQAGRPAIREDASMRPPRPERRQ